METEVPIARRRKPEDAQTDDLVVVGTKRWKNPIMEGTPIKEGHSVDPTKREKNIDLNREKGKKLGGTRHMGR
jgi:hypothetical protein